MGDKSKGGGDAGGGGAKANDVFRDPFIRYLGIRIIIESIFNKIMFIFITSGISKHL